MGAGCASGSLAKHVDPVSFSLVQAACGHGQLHLAVKSLRLVWCAVIK